MEAILYGIAQGFTLKASCKFAGVSYSTLAWWLAKGKYAKQSNIKNKYTDVLERINHATHAEKIKHRKSFFNLKASDFRYGWKNPMPLRARKKISNFWKQRKLKFICGNQL